MSKKRTSFTLQRADGSVTADVSLLAKISTVKQMTSRDSMKSLLLKNILNLVLSFHTINYCEYQKLSSIEKN